MKKLIAALALSSTLALGACTPPTTQQIQTATLAACNFLPTAVTIASFIPAAGPYLVTADGIATAICAALADQQPKATARRAPGALSVTVYVAGARVEVTGHFVK